MNIDNPVWIGIYHTLRNHHKAACQHNKICSGLLKFQQQGPIKLFFFRVICPCNTDRRNARFGCALQRILVAASLITFTTFAFVIFPLSIASRIA